MCITVCPADHTMTGLLETLDVMREPLGADECEGADLGRRQYGVQPRRCGKERTPLRDYIIDKHDPVHLKNRRHRDERIVVLLHARPCGSSRSSRLDDRVTPLQGSPHG